MPREYQASKGRSNGRHGWGALLVACSLLFASTHARADRTAADPFDPGVALAHSAGFTLGNLAVGGLVALRDPVVGSSIVVLGMAIGPSAGHFHVENWSRALVMTGTRLALGTSALILLAAASGGRCDGCWMPGSAFGGIAFGLAIVDIIDAPHAARRANAETARPRTATIAPWLAPAGQGGGVALAGFF